HLERDEAVEHGKGGVAQVVAHGVWRTHAGGALVLDGRDEALVLDDLPRREVFTGLRCHCSIEARIEVALELRGNVLLEELSCSLGGSFDGLACGLFHRGDSY